ncbi:MAG: hypothetical protein K0M63_10945 [Weeksellaceae bacterium]|nr:hypothetical protein [Weeksellaceae bacterium]
MSKREKTILIILTVLNAVVLLGQIYPEGAPPFAAWVNIVFLVASLIYFISRFSSKDKS